MARFLTSHPKAPLHVTLSPSTALRINSAKGLKSRFFAAIWLRMTVPPVVVSRRAWRLSMAGLACLTVAPSLAHAHGGMAGPGELGPPIFTSGLLGFVCYWLVMLWPSPKKKGNPEVGSSRQNRDAPRTYRRAHKHAAHVKQVSRLRKLERSGHFGSDQPSGRKAIDG